MEPQKTPHSQNDPEKKNEARGVILSDFKFYYRTMTF